MWVLGCRRDGICGSAGMQECWDAGVPGCESTGSQTAVTWVSLFGVGGDSSGTLRLH